MYLNCFTLISIGIWQLFVSEMSVYSNRKNISSTIGLLEMETEDDVPFVLSNYYVHNQHKAKTSKQISHRYFVLRFYLLESSFSPFILH
jgi:hypothetical protein